MHVRICGPRGSVPAPGLGTTRYGGNTSCIQLGLSDGTHVILDAGTGIRNADIHESAECIHVLLTHLHLDHIQGLLFFAPLFEATADVTIWGPAAGGIPLRNRISRYMSAPLTPVELRELPSHVEFRDCPAEEWTIGSATIQADAVIHRGPTLGFRIEDAGTTLCYLPDHEPALLGPLDTLADPWLSGHRLAHRAQLLVHDAQYSQAEYPQHSGWGHSATAHVVDFAARSEAERTVLFHHDPSHTDEQLDDLFEEVRDLCTKRGVDPDTLELGREQAEIELGVAA